MHGINNDISWRNKSDQMFWEDSIQQPRKPALFFKQMPKDN